MIKRLCLGIAAALALSAQPASAACGARLMPAPPVVHYAYGLDTAVMASGQHPSAYTYTDTQTVYLPDRAKSPTNAFIRAHETGHLFDSEVLNDGDRAYFAKLLQAPTGAWVQDHLAQSPNERFADYYGAAASGIDAAHGYSVSTYAPIGLKRLKRFEAAIRRLAQRRAITQTYRH